MAAGVPIVTQNQWGWREMIRHGETGFLCDTDEELAHWTAVLAHDEDRRLAIATAARQAVEQLADPATIWAGWRKLFASVGLEVERTSVRSAPR
jgi:glycosyltransferase involved in cell wall biosynthesis